MNRVVVAPTTAIQIGIAGGTRAITRRRRGSPNFSGRSAAVNGAASIDLL
ncbi:MAG: hypothetical protein AAGE01_25510 [Pseudomonadota bacterium]